jgi:hypothetical protein
MGSYGLKLGLVAGAIVVLGGLAIWLFSELWLRIGLITAIVVLGGALLLVAWRADRKGKAVREGLERV